MARRKGARNGLAVLGWHSWWNALAAVGAGVLAGIVNSVAGGGTNISFPVLLWLGLPPITANATSATVLWPGVMSAAAGFAPEIRKSPRRWYWLAIPSFVGGAIGAYLLVHTPSAIFRSIAPWLVIGSSVLMAAEPFLVKRFTALQAERRGTRWMALALIVQLVISAYGGYLGARVGRKLKQSTMRWVAVGIGVTLGVVMLIQTL